MAYTVPECTNLNTDNPIADKALLLFAEFTEFEDIASDTCNTMIGLDFEIAINARPNQFGLDEYDAKIARAIATSIYYTYMRSLAEETGDTDGEGAGVGTVIMLSENN